MSEQLDKAYELIKAGQNNEAINILEDAIRADRNNEDAWWLFANASDEPEAKRNALNNVLRLSDNTERQNKARALMQSLQVDQYDFDFETNSSVKMGTYQAIDDAPPKKSGRFNCATISLILVGLIGVCACIGVFGIFAAAGDIMGFVNAPTTYVDNGTLELNENYTGTLDEDNPAAGFLYAGDSGDQLFISVESDGIVAPFIIIYDTSDGVLVAIAQSQGASQNATMNFTLPDDDEYLITLRGARIFGTDIGFGDYTLEADSR